MSFTLILQRGGLLASLMGGLLILSACSAPTDAPASLAPSTAPAIAAPVTKKLNVVATTTIIADMARNVAGTAADVTSLIGPGVDPHEFQPAPRDAQTLAQAVILLENGAGLEAWLADLTQSSGTKARVIVVSDGLKLREGEEDAHGAAVSAPGGTSQVQAAHEYDPHVWLDVQNGIKVVETIRDGLSAADPANAATYKANADTYLAQLKDTDSYLVQQTASLPKERRKLVTSHDSLGYFADRYGYEVVGALIPSVSSDAQPSAKDMAALLTQVKTEGVPAIFTESTLNPQLVEQLAKDAKVKVVSNLYTDSLSEAGKSADTYIKMMRYDIDQIVAALK